MLRPVRPIVFLKNKTLAFFFKKTTGRTGRGLHSWSWAPPSLMFGARASQDGQRWCPSGARAAICGHLGHVLGHLGCHLRSSSAQDTTQMAEDGASGAIIGHLGHVSPTAKASNWYMEGSTSAQRFFHGIVTGNTK